MIQVTVVLVLFDLTAAFDTVDHKILLSCFNQLVSIPGTALDLFKSYLVHRSFCVNILDYHFVHPCHESHRAQF